jgi:hypothetical protein
MTTPRGGRCVFLFLDTVDADVDVDVNDVDVNDAVDDVNNDDVSIGVLFILTLPYGTVVKVFFHASEVPSGGEGRFVPLGDEIEYSLVWQRPYIVVRREREANNEASVGR